MAVATGERPLVVDGEQAETGEWQEVRSEGAVHPIRELTEERLVVVQGRRRAPATAAHEAPYPLV